MFVLYYKRPYIIQEPLRKNRTHQTWRPQQLALCKEKEPLEEYIKSKPQHFQSQYYIEHWTH